MDFAFVLMATGFILTAYSVIANDSVQTLGTFMASNAKVRWQYLWLAASAVLIATLTYSWVAHGGDISYGRLSQIPYQEIQWYHALAPLGLVLLTQFGIPVSTSLLIFSAFASSLVFEKILVKSFLGYGLSALVAFTLWILVLHFVKNTKNTTETHSSEKTWRVAQWCATGFLWWSWLSHDVANIAVFLPRALPFETLVTVLVILTAALGYIFWKRGGKIQNIVLTKTNVAYVKAATFIDLTYAFLLLFFKQYNDIPMSTTWVFVGLLAGREFAISLTNKDYHFRNLFPIVGKDMLKVIFGLAISVVVVLFVQYMNG